MMNGDIGVPGDLSQATKPSSASGLSAEAADSMARARVQPSAQVSASSQAHTVFLWAAFLATAAAILFAWRTGYESLKPGALMHPGRGMNLRVIELPGGTTLEAPRRGFIDSLVGALASHEGADIGPFIFDRTDYTPESARLPAPSGAQLEQLAAVLSAFPNATVSIEGHTDNVGDAGADRKLSAQRAAAVKAELVAMGVAAKRLTSVGYGQSRPIVGNGSDEGRARNRRVQVTITQP